MVAPVICAGWYLVFPLGIGLLLHARFPNTISALGTLVAAYGCGNIISNVVLGSVMVRNQGRVLVLGWIATGCGFVALGTVHTFRMMLLAAAFSATGGPMMDLSLANIVQSYFAPREIAPVYRIYTAANYSALLVALFLSPLLFQRHGIPAVIWGSGTAMVAAGLLGLVSRFPPSSASLNSSGHLRRGAG
jgi:hypothetical protein